MNTDTEALLLIDIQKGFMDETYWGKRNNPSFEENISKLLNSFRCKNKKIIHVQHSSKNLKSPLRPNQTGFEFMDIVNPKNDEPIFSKSVNSAFIGTHLEEYLHQQNIKSLIIAGLVTDHCVSTTTRMAANLGFNVTLVEDATATFDRIGTNGEHYSAELIHKVSLASLKNEFAEIKSTYELMN